MHGMEEWIMLKYSYYQMQLQIQLILLKIAIVFCTELETKVGKVEQKSTTQEALDNLNSIYTSTL